MLTHSSKIQPQLFTAFTLAGRCAGLDLVLLAQSLEQNVGATEQKVTDAVNNVCALKCSAPEDQLGVVDATQECGLELAVRWVFPFLPSKTTSNSSREPSRHLLASTMKVSLPNRHVLMPCFRGMCDRR